jgi:glycosyltransferase involved in cell wall biosynthesis
MPEHKQKIFHMLPANFEACGGLYVHYQFCKIEAELGYDSYIAFPDEIFEPHVTWFAHNCKEINYSTIHKIILDDIPVGEPILLIGWEDIYCMRAFLQYTALHKVAFIQNQAYFKGKEYYDGFGAKLWFPSTWVRTYLKQDGDCIPQYIDPSVFMPYGDFKDAKDILKTYELPDGANMKLKVFVQQRKQGLERVKELLSVLDVNLINKLDFTLCPSLEHKAYAVELKKYDLFFAHSYPEGLPLTPMEAMASGVVVFGYTGGGGSYYMHDGYNSIIAADGDYIGLAEKLKEKLFYRVCSNMFMLRNNGYTTAEIFNEQRTTEQLQSALYRILNKEA